MKIGTQLNPNVKKKKLYIKIQNRNPSKPRKDGEKKADGLELK